MDWDAWRSTRASTTPTIERDFYSEVYAHHPVQQHFDSFLVGEAVDDLRPRTVVELGGWDGELATLMLDQSPYIEHWTLAEICTEAAEQARQRNHPRLEVAELNGWFWEQGWHADLFVASHAIEHLTTEDLAKTFACLDVEAMYLDAPIGYGPRDWTGYQGSHVLPIGWGEIDRLHDLELVWSLNSRYGQARLYRR